jgi:hypothetical protein
LGRLSISNTSARLNTLILKKSKHFWLIGTCLHEVWEMLALEALRPKKRRKNFVNFEQLK